MGINVYENYQNQYSLNKTIRNELIPIGKTKDWMEKEGILREDEERAESYKKVKKLIDEYHKRFISECLKKVEISYLDEYFSSYTKIKVSSDKKELEKLNELMRKDIVKNIKKNEKYNSLFSKEMITKNMHEFLDGREEEKLLTQFEKFSTYFKNFHENRKNMYSEEEKSTAIAYRIINQNLPRFIDNIKIFEIVKDSPIYERILDMNKDYKDKLDGKSIEDYFILESYNTTITNEQITLYNALIGGIVSDTYNIKGINQYINLYNQENSKDKAFKKVPKLNMLYKQILADRETFSFIGEQFESDSEVIENVKSIIENLKGSVLKENGENSVFELIKNINKYDIGKIYISNGININQISNSLYGDWSVIKRGIEEDYDLQHNNVKRNEKYFEKKDREIKGKKFYSLKYLNEVVGRYQGKDIPVEEYFINCKDNNGNSYYEIFVKAYIEAKDLLNTEFSGKRGINGNKKYVQLLKNLLDSVKNIELFIKPLLVNGNESDIDFLFYGELQEIYSELSVITPLYNKVRNYVTRKPYSTEKIKLNFGNPDFIDGWAVGIERQKSGLIFRDDKFYYLGVIPKGKSNYFKEYPLPENDEDKFYKMQYLQAADPQKDVQNLMIINGKTMKKNGRREKTGIHAGENLVLEELKNTYLPEDINEIRKNKSYSKQNMDRFNKNDLCKFIDYYKERAIEYFSEYEFVFKPSEEYKDFGEFTDDINSQAYQLKFIEVSRKHIDSLIDEGKLYLFKIYNKDFSEYSKGTPNLHTIYFKMLFDERNLRNVVYKLDGGAEVFYRKASINLENMVIHKKNEPIKNKNADVVNRKPNSIFDYDLIKDKRYTVDKFQLHMPITLGFGARGNSKLNDNVLQTIRSNKDMYVIGIDRGERNLLYLSVIDSNGKIVEQESMNVIKTDKEYKQDYHRLLQDKEKVRNEERRNWNTVETIKELKEGYLSQVINKIVKYMLKYNAIVVLEDLNSGFKNSRIKVEKQVYQKFEKMLIDKLNYLVDKTKDVDEVGGALHAYQLTNKFESFKKMSKQNGFLFYIPPWNTSKIDPTTGFVNLLRIKYTSVDDSVSFISKFKRIAYNGEYFEFDIDYNDFTEKASGTKTNWTLCSYGTRIINFRNPEKNSEWDSKEVNITEKIMRLLLEYSIDIRQENLVKQIIEINKKDFFKEFLNCLNLVVQIRNSITNSDIDYMISPIKNANNEFFDTRNYDSNSYLPCDADANGAYNIAKKGLWIMEQIRNTESNKINLAISNKEWLNYAQEHVML